MIISGIIKSSLVDYPGQVACVLFVPGCNYNCFYCHNRSLIDGTHETLSLDSIRDFLIKRSKVLDGVVITGGEPTIYADLIPSIRLIKNLGYKVKLDTNGSSPNVIQQLLEQNLCDYYAVDYKAPSGRYQEICGKQADPGAVLETIRLLASHHAAFEVRTTVIPQLSELDLSNMAKELPKVPRYSLNRYRKPEKFLDCDKSRINALPYTQIQINHFVGLLHTEQPNAVT